MRRQHQATGRRLRLLAAAWLTISGGALAAEVYTWTDADGVVHFSDAPPTSGEARTIEAEEAFRPGSVGIPSPGADGAAAPEAATSSVAETRREAIRQRGAEQREQRQETERMCALHRDRLEKMEPARRVFYRNEAGEEVRMDDDQRMALIEEDKAFLADNCR